MKKIIITMVVAAMVLLGMTSTATAGRPALDTWAFCGVNPSLPEAQGIANNMARYGGIDATFGPCMAPDWGTYTAANPGRRYISPDAYFRLVVINANAGMKTVVYDARLWSDDENVRNQAIAFWAPHVAWIRAFDMGDEFDPNGPEWSTLIHRWNNVLNYVTPLLGVGPFTNHLPWAMEAALRDLPGSVSHLSFDDYVLGEATWLADHFDGLTNHLMCSVAAMPVGAYNVTSSSVIRSMRALRANGCDSFLIFGGVQPYSVDGFSPDPTFGPSLVKANGFPTSMASAVRIGAM